MATNLDTILSYLTGTLGLSSAQAAGVAGNLQVESGFSPTAANPKEGAIGIAQWEGGRRQQLDAYAAATGGAEQNLNTQLGFLGYELNTSESSALQRLLATNDPASAAAAFDQYYERSSGSSRATRVSDAQAIAAGTPTTGGTASSSGGLNVQNAGFLGIPSMNDVGTLVLKGIAGLGALALVVVGVKETVRGQGS